MIWDALRQQCPELADTGFDSLFRRTLYARRGFLRTGFAKDQAFSFACLASILEVQVVMPSTAAPVACPVVVRIPVKPDPLFPATDLARAASAEDRRYLLPEHGPHSLSKPIGCSITPNDLSGSASPGQRSLPTLCIMNRGVRGLQSTARRRRRISGLRNPGWTKSRGALYPVYEQYVTGPKVHDNSTSYSRCRTCSAPMRQTRAMRFSGD